jgi:hypothetical protein
MYQLKVPNSLGRIDDTIALLLDQFVDASVATH